jgi:hypothetical protein
VKRLLPALLLLAPAAAPAGPFDQPYAIITSETAPSADPKLRPVVVSRVDGESTTRNRATVAPGKRSVTVDLPPRKGFSLGTQATFELEASPCMRYYVAARLDTTTGQEWTPVVGRSETIGECLTKFKGGVSVK